MKKITRKSRKNLLLSTSLLCSFLGSQASIAQPTLLDILAQDDLSLRGSTIRLSLPYQVKEGPEDKYAYIAQPELRVRKDSRGNFLCYPSLIPMSPLEELWGLQRYKMEPLKNFPSLFDTVHTFGVVSYAASLHAGDVCELYNVNASNAPLALYPYDEGGCNNAYFSPQGRGSLHFMPARIPSPDPWTELETCTGRQLGWTCHSFDIPVHEFGHAGLHRLRPGFISSWRPETGALHEAYGDLTVVFTGLSLPPLRKQVLRLTHGDLHSSSFLPEIGEEFGQILGQGQHGIRSINNDLTIRDIDCEVHSLSRVFSGAVYDTLASSFEARQNSFWSYFSLELDDDTLLRQVSTDLRQLTLKAFITVPSEAPTFSEVGRTMYKIAQNTSCWAYLANHIESCFSERGINIDSVPTGFTRCDKEVLLKIRAGKDLGLDICDTANKLWPSAKRIKASKKINNY